MRTLEAIDSDLKATEDLITNLRSERMEVSRDIARRWADAQAGRHNNACEATRVAGMPHAYWREDDTCSYCGSLSVARAIEALTTPGTTYSGSDWKYGWPHKFYIEPHGKHAKFYSVHLQDATEVEFEKFNALSRDLFGIGFNLNDDKNDKSGQKILGYSAPAHNWQKHGTIA